MTQSEFEHIAQELRSQMLKVAITGRCRRRGTGRDGAAVALLRADRQRAQRVWSGCQGGKELLCQPL